MAIFSWQVVRAAVTPPFEFREFFKQLDEIGFMSLPLIGLAGAVIGVVLSLEARYSLTRFAAKSLLPAAIVFSVIHETGPIITGLIVSGRVGAALREDRKQEPFAPRRNTRWEFGIQTIVISSCCQSV